MPYLTAKLQGFGTTIFAEMSALATTTGSVNLGQGFPDSDGPREVLDAAIDAINAGMNQYPPGPGMPVLRQAIAAHQSRFYGLTYDPDTEVLVTAGATEALAGALLALLDTGDEVVVFEPMFDSYAPCIAMAGAIAKPVTLRPPDFGFDADELRAAITPKTKLILFNSPHNPTGRVFSREEVQLVADLALQHDLLVVTDEVYEHLLFDDAEHLALAALPGMRDRTLVISSGGKTFSTTGWKIGWLCGAAPLVTAVRTAKQFLTYVNGGPFQPAIALGLGLPDSFYAALAADLQAKRDRLLPGLVDAGFTVFPTTRRTSSRSTSVRCSPTVMGWRSAGRCHIGVVSSPFPPRCSTRTSTRAAIWCASRSASNSTCSTKPCAASRPSADPLLLRRTSLVFAHRT